MGDGEEGNDFKGEMAIWIDIMGRLTFKFSSIEEDGKYHSNLAVSAQLIYFLEMLKFSNFLFLKKKKFCEGK
jgi:hypothetical protein